MYYDSSGVILYAYDLVGKEGLWANEELWRGGVEVFTGGGG